MINSMIDECFGSGLFKDIIDMVNNNLFSSSGEYSTAFETVKGLYDTIVLPAASMLLCIYFLIAITDKLASEHFTWDQAIRQMCMLLLGFFIITRGFEILNTLFQIGVDFVGQVGDWVQGKGGTNGTVGSDVAEKVKDIYNAQKFSSIKVFDNLLKFCYLLIPYIGQWLLGMCVKIICYTRIIEIYIRAAFAPIAFCDFFQNGFQGAGWRFLKAFLAVCLQGAVIVAIAAIYTAVMPIVFNMDNDPTFFDVMGRYLAILAAAVMLMFKSLSLTKEFVGVN